MVKQHFICPVCGFPMDDPPMDYNICPSCGTEFGINDVNSTVQDLRVAWIENGLGWWSRTDAPPTGWSPFLQLAGVLAAAVVSESEYEIVPAHQLMDLTRSGLVPDLSFANTEPVGASS